MKMSLSGKRIVFVGPAGTAILGYCPPEQKLPVTLPLEDQEAFEILGRTVTFMSLVRVTERAAYYQEPMTPSSRTFTQGVNNAPL
jgi:hypothetical protein